MAMKDEFREVFEANLPSTLDEFRAYVIGVDPLADCWFVRGVFIVRFSDGTGVIIDAEPEETKH